MDLRLEHAFENITPLAYWELFFDDEAYAKAIHAHLRVEVLSLEVDKIKGGEAMVAKRTLRLRPLRETPGFLGKLLGGSTTVTDLSELDLAAGRMVSSITLPTIGSRVDYGGTYRWQQRGSGFNRIFEGYCRARIPLLGGRLERYFLDELKKSIDAAYEFTVGWLNEHPR